MAALLMGCATHSPFRDRGLAPSISTAQALTGTLGTRRYAVLIGVDQYDDPVFPTLKHAAADARGLGDVLESAPQGGFDEVTVLTGDAVTDREAIFETLRVLKRELRREDVLVVYFSGHGTRVRDGERWRRFLLASDSRSSDLQSSAIDLLALQEFFSSLAPARKALVLDACFSGDGKSVVRPDDADAEVDSVLGVVAPRSTGMGPGEAHLYATSPGRPAREDDDLGHGVYTWFLMESLSWAFADADVDGDGVVTVYEAHDYARGRTMDRTDGVQVPEASFRVVGEADLVLSGSPDERVRRNRSLVYLYPSSTDPLNGASVVVDGRYRGSLPGTVPIEAGRHHVRVRDASGDLISEGFVILSGDNAYSVRELTRLAQGPRGVVGMRAVSFFSPPMSDRLGPGAPGLELTLNRRANQGLHRGIFGHLDLGIAVGPARDASGSADPRWLSWGLLGMGYQHDHQRLRYRAGWSGSLVVLSPSTHEQTEDALRSKGWLFWTTGPEGGLGYVVDSSWSLMFDARVHGSWLDLDGTGQHRLVPWLGLTAGVELTL
jgi:hypothetical protein